MRFILNIIWLVLCGIWMSIAYAVAGLICFLLFFLVVTIPFGIAAFRIANYVLWPFGRTIAHGYLSLSLMPALVATLVEYSGWGVKINYGSNKVRFPAPVPVGSRVRATVTILRVDETPAGVQVTTRVQVDIEDPDGVPTPKPALVAELVTLLAAPTDSSGRADSSD